MHVFIYRSECGCLYVSRRRIPLHHYIYRDFLWIFRYVNPFLEFRGVHRDKIICVYSYGQMWMHAHKHIHTMFYKEKWTIFLHGSPSYMLNINFISFCLQINLEEKAPK